jgi:hypothetical protein
MRVSGSGKEKLDLKVKLRQWMRVAYLFVQRRESRFKVHAQQYRDLHHELLHVVGAAASGSEPRRQMEFQELREMLMPWVNVESGVLERCEAVRRSLGGGLAAYRRWMGPTLIVIGLGIALGVVLVLWDPLTGSNAASGLALSFRNWARWLFATVVGESVHRQLLLGGGVAATITMLVVWYAARKY